MIRFLEKNLSAFRSCFSRKRTFELFVILVIGLLVRTDALGVTSVIRGLSTQTSLYESLIHFFRSTAYQLEDIRHIWLEIIINSGHLYTLAGRCLLFADGTKLTKEGFFMPGVKRLHQDSENSAKPDYMYGHFFGGLAVAAGTDEHAFAIPVLMEIQDGLAELAKWDESQSYRALSHVVRMVENAYEAAMELGRSIVCMDRYFLTVPALKRLDELNANDYLLDIITRAKTNCIAYEEPTVSAVPRRGRPPKKGAPVKLNTLFETRKSDFVTKTAMMYGKPETVEYLCQDLLWGKGLYKKLRFVLVKSRLGTAIFVCTDLTLDPELIIQGYADRFKIEILFRELKTRICGFGYHFWSKYMPKMNRYKKKTDPDTLACVTDEKEQVQILKTVKATECFVLLSSIALGLTQLLALEKKYAETFRKGRYLRTQSENRISEATVLDYLRKHFFRLLLLAPDSEITKIIRRASRDDFTDDDDQTVV